MPVRDPDPGLLRLSRDHELFRELVKHPAIQSHIEQINGGVGHIQMAEKRRQLADSLRITASVSPYLHKVLEAVKQLLHLEKSVELYVAPAPFLNAFSMTLPDDTGLLVVITSAAVERFTRGELLFLVGHELGHGILGHHRLPGTALLNPMDEESRLSWDHTTQLLRWMRTSEISADRFGLVCCQDPTLATRVFLKLASGLPGKYLGTGEDFDDQMNDWVKSKIAGEGMDATHPLLPIRVRCGHAFAESDYFTHLFGDAAGSSRLSMEGADQECHEQLAAMDGDPTHIETLDYPEEVMGFLALAGFLLAAADDDIAAVEYHWLTQLVGRELAERAREFAQEVGFEAFCREIYTLGAGIAQDYDRRQCLKLVSEIAVIAAVDGFIQPNEVKGVNMIAEALQLPSHLADVVIKDLGRADGSRLNLRG
jgi:hypothetical protein